MQELDKAMDVAMTGPEAEQAMAEFRRQTAVWKVAMPPVVPLVLDFGLGDFRHTGLIESWIANEGAAGYCGKYLFVFDGQTCPAHRHRRKHETFFVVKGGVRMTCQGASREMNEGDVLAVPTDAVHSFCGLGPALLLELSTPCEIDDNYFQDRRIPIGGNYRGNGLPH